MKKRIGKGGGKSQRLRIQELGKEEKSEKAIHSVRRTRVGKEWKKGEFQTKRGKEWEKEESEVS